MIGAYIQNLQERWSKEKAQDVIVLQIHEIFPKQKLHYFKDIILCFGSRIITINIPMIYNLALELLIVLQPCSNVQDGFRNVLSL